MIYLIRHATPLVDYGRCGAHTARTLLDEYNRTSIIDEDEIAGFLSQPELSGPVLSPEATVFSSPVSRAYATASRLFEAERIKKDSRLREYDLRLSGIPLLRMTLRQWFALHRVLWLAGISLGATPRKDEYLRAMGVADEIYKLRVATGTPLIVVSHGMFLRTVRKTLQKQGMRVHTVYRSGCFTVESLSVREHAQ